MSFKHRIDVKHSRRKLVDAILITCLILSGVFGQPQLATGQMFTQPKIKCAKRDIGILLDSSSSITITPHISPFQAMRTFVKNVIGRLETDWDSVAVVHFSEQVEVVFNFNTFTKKDEMYQAVDDILKFNENTNIGIGLKTLRTETFAPGKGERPDVPNIALVITDGSSNIEVDSMPKEAKLLRDAGVTVYTVGVTGEPSFSELTTISSGLEYVLPSVDYYNLMSIPYLDRIMDILCTPEKPERPANCQNALDLAIILDQSSSIIASGDNSFWHRDILGFVSNLILNFNISKDLTRVGMVKFSHFAYSPFNLLSYSNMSKLIQVVRNLPIEGGQTNIASGLMIARKDVFTHDRGDRSDVVNVAVLITDGESNADRDLTASEASHLRSVGVEIFVVGIGKHVSSEELQSIASQPLDKHLFNVSNFMKLDNIWKEVGAAVCNAEGESQTYTSPAPVCHLPNCFECAVSSSTCDKCKTGYNLIRGVCFAPFQCLIDQCRMCYAPNSCAVCNDGYILWDGMCTTNIPKPGEPKDPSGDCYVLNCLKCPEGASNVCAQCRGGYNLIQGACITPFQCQVNDCQLCYAPNACAECLSGHYLWNNTCTSSLPLVIKPQAVIGGGHASCLRYTRTACLLMLMHIRI